MPTFDLLLPPQSYPPWRPARTARSQRRTPIRLLTATWRSIAASIDRSNQRRALAEMEDYMLRDIGITRVEAERECRKPFWR